MEHEIELPPGDAGSPYAQEGTAAHALAYLRARREILGDLTRLEYETELVHWRELYRNVVEDEEEMHYHVSAYLDHLRVQLEEPGSVLLLEQRVPTGVPSCWGTSDAVVVSPTRIQITDLKYGKGVEVSAAENPQLRLYGVGALEAFGDLLGVVESVSMTVFQPRINNIETEEMSALMLRAWRDSIIPIAEEALGHNAHFGPSDTACRWCPAAGQCSAQLAWATAVDFGPIVSDFDQEKAAYWARHDQVRKVRGTANRHLCIDCGEQARDWSQIHGTSGDLADHYQPRCRSCHMKYDDLTNLGDYMLPGREMSEGERVRLTGLARVKYQCNECGLSSNLGGIATHQRATKHEGVTQPRTEVLSVDELAEVLDKIPAIEAWCAAVKDYALDLVYSKGKEVPGYKVVMSGGKRSIPDEELALEALEIVGFTFDQVGRRKLKTLGDLEKLLRRSFDTVLGPFVVKGTGSPSLVPETDSRPSITPNQEAARAFRVLEGGQP